MSSLSNRNADNTRSVTKGHFTKDYKSGQQNYVVKGINLGRDHNRVKVIREYLIKHFAFYYNNAYKVYKDAKYGIK